MRKTLLFAVVCFAVSLMAQGTKVGPSTVWRIPSSFLANAHKACDNAAQPPSFAECFINQMSKAGAPPESVAFTRELMQQSKGDVGILTGFHAVGPVDLAWITYPLRANTNYGLLLVNGQPPIVNVEDLNLLDQQGMQQSPQFQDLKNQFPSVGVWPGDRSGQTWPNSQTGPNGGLQFTVGYPLINGCHACARAGFALFNWNFDPQGKFKGTSFLGMTPAPLK